MALFEKPAFLILLLIIILLFGAKRLPDLARGVGRSLRIFKAETDGLKTDGTPAEQAAAQQAVSSAPAPSPAPVVDPGPRYLVDPVTGQQVLAQPVTPPADGAPRV
jgi:sec-independent protein translocase protein TatA